MTKEVELYGAHRRAVQRATVGQAISYRFKQLSAALGQLGATVTFAAEAGRKLAAVAPITVGAMVRDPRTGREGVLRRIEGGWGYVKVAGRSRHLRASYRNLELRPR